MISNAHSNIESYRKIFFENGYVVLRKHLSDILIAEIREEIRTVLHEALNLLGLSMSSDLDKAYLSLKEQSPALKGRAYDVMGSLQSVQQVFSISFLPALIHSIIGSPAIIDHTQVRIDDMTNDRLLPMHQEMAQMSLINVTAWIPLQDINPDRDGGLRVIPGSHTRGLLPHRLFETPHPYYGVCENYFQPIEEHRLVLSKGDILLFHPLLVHGSVPNKSDRIRWTIVGRLNGLKTLRYLECNERRYPNDRNSSAYEKYTTGLSWA